SPPVRSLRTGRAEPSARTSWKPSGPTAVGPASGPAAAAVVAPGAGPPGAAAAPVARASVAASVAAVRVGRRRWRVLAGLRLTMGPLAGRPDVDVRSGACRRPVEEVARKHRRTVMFLLCTPGCRGSWPGPPGRA